MKMNLKSWLVGSTMLMMTATGAFAETVLNRGNSADPESLDPHKTSTVYEANILRDLFLDKAGQGIGVDRLGDHVAVAFRPQRVKEFVLAAREQRERDGFSVSMPLFEVAG